MYLDYFRLVQILSNEQDPRKAEVAKQSLASLVLLNTSAFGQLEVMNHLGTISDDPNTPLNSELLLQMHNRSLYKIEKYFQDYTKTWSYKEHVLGILEHNDYLNQRLIDFDMENTVL